MKSIEYSIRYMLIIVVLYYIVPLSYFYKMSFALLGIIPLNFLAIKYGIYNKLDKDIAKAKEANSLAKQYDFNNEKSSNVLTKEYIILPLIIYTTILNIAFLLLNKTKIIVIIIACTINVIELLFTKNPIKKADKK